MESTEMLFETNRGVAYLTVNRPEQRNAMTWAMYQRLVETCEQVFAATPCLCWDAPFDELNVAKQVCEETI